MRDGFFEGIVFKAYVPKPCDWCGAPSVVTYGPMNCRPDDPHQHYCAACEAERQEQRFHGHVEGGE